MLQSQQIKNNDKRNARVGRICNEKIEVWSAYIYIYIYNTHI